MKAFVGIGVCGGECKFFGRQRLGRSACSWGRKEKTAKLLCTLLEKLIIIERVCWRDGKKSKDILFFDKGTD